MTPMISVVMPVYNGEKYLREAIESILNQTYKDFEFIILNDGSTDNTEEIILSYEDPRIVYIKNDKNLQIVETLNRGISLAKGKYIARMDADDISLPERFACQVEILEKSDEIIICGSYAETFGEECQTSIWKMPLTHPEIETTLLFHTAFIHPSVMMRANVIKENNLKYESIYEGVEDYALWMKMVQYGQMYNIPKPLLRYRIVANSITRTLEKANDKKRRMLLSLYKEYANRYSIALDDAQLAIHADLVSNKKNILDVYSVIQYFNYLKQEIMVLDERVLKFKLGQLYMGLCRVTKDRKNCIRGSVFLLYAIKYYITRAIVEYRNRCETQ